MQLVIHFLLQAHNILHEVVKRHVCPLLPAGLHATHHQQAHTHFECDPVKCPLLGLVLISSSAPLTSQCTVSLPYFPCICNSLQVSANNSFRMKVGRRNGGCRVTLYA